MKTIKMILVLYFILFFSVTVKAQTYNTTPTIYYGYNQFGIRVGGFSGIDYEHVFNNNMGFKLDVLDATPFGRGMVEGLVQKNFPFRNGKGFVPFIGIGGFVATQYENRVYLSENPYQHVYYLNPVPGFTGMAGIDYYIPNIPIVIGLDMRPRISIYGDNLWDGSISGRFIF